MRRSISRLRPSRMGFQARLFFAFVGVAVIPLSILAGLHRIQLVRHAEVDAELRAAQLADVQRRRVDSEMQRLREQVELVASRTQMRLSLAEHATSRDPVHRRMIARILEDAIGSVSDVLEIWVRDTSDQVVVSTVPDPDTRRIAEVEALPEPGDRTITLDWYDDGLRSIWSTTALRLNGELIGTLHVRMGVTSLHEVLRDFEDERTGVACALILIDDDGTERRFRPHEDTFELVPGSLLETRTDRFEDVRDAESARAARPLESLHGFVVTEVTLAGVLATMNDQITLLGLNLMGLLVLATLSAWMASGMVARPVRALRAATLRVRRGERGVRVAEDAWGEFSLLNRSFNEMAGRIERSRDAMRREILRSRSAQRELADMAHHDPLTGLMNRRRFLELLEERASGPDREGALLYLDLDDFKPINDLYGHEVGDEVLRIVAGRLGRLVRAGDLTARLGGDEFAILLAQDLPATELVQLVGRVRRALASPMMVDGRRLQILCSVGFADLDADPEPHQVLDRADRAMYQDKSRRRRRRDARRAAEGEA